MALALIKVEIWFFCFFFEKTIPNIFSENNLNAFLFLIGLNIFFNLSETTIHRLFLNN